MSAKVLIRAGDDGTSCGIRASSSFGSMMSRSDIESSVAYGGTTVKHGQDTASGPRSVNARPSVHDERGTAVEVDEISRTPLGFPEQVMVLDGRVEPVQPAHARQSVAKIRESESLDSNIYI